MNKAQRVEAAIKGEAVDRIPFSVWYHLSGVDQDPVSLAETTAELTKKYDYDFVKMMPFGLYGVQDLGAKVKIFSKQGEPPLWERGPVQRVEDYLALTPIPAIQGTYGKQLEFTELLRKQLPGDVPYIQTIFSPLTTLHKLVGDRVLEYAMRWQLSRRLLLILSTKISSAASAASSSLRRMHARS